MTWIETLVCRIFTGPDCYYGWIFLGLLFALGAKKCIDFISPTKESGNTTT